MRQNIRLEDKVEDLECQGKQWENQNTKHKKEYVELLEIFEKVWYDKYEPQA